MLTITNELMTMLAPNAAAIANAKKISQKGGNRAGLLRRIEEMRTSGVTVVSLLGIADVGKMYYDTQMAQRILAMGIRCFACTPALLPQLLEMAFKGYDLKALEKTFEKKTGM